MLTRTLGPSRALNLELGLVVRVRRSVNAGSSLTVFLHILLTTTTTLELDCFRHLDDATHTTVRILTA